MNNSTERLTLRAAGSEADEAIVIFRMLYVIIGYLRIV